MTSDRPYRDAPGREFALAELRRCAGTQFDPTVVDALCVALDRLPVAVPAI
jgi:HD-GYP domain-containing protein (c-di-GMP phosphodiesterase class II)